MQLILVKVWGVKYLDKTGIDEIRNHNPLYFDLDYW